jgi:hypothetical protein
MGAPLPRRKNVDVLYIAAFAAMAALAVALQEFCLDLQKGDQS